MSSIIRMLIADIPVFSPVVPYPFFLNRSLHFKLFLPVWLYSYHRMNLASAEQSMRLDRLLLFSSRNFSEVLTSRIMLCNETPMRSTSIQKFRDLRSI